MEDCIFCKIAAGAIPSATLYEDEEFRAILDLGPARRGHTLLIPKKHYADLFEMPDELVCRAVLTAKEVAAALKKGLDCDGVQVVQNNGEAAGQTVFHYHMHLIPAWNSEGPGAVWIPGSLSDEDRDDIAAAVKEAF